MSGTGSRATTRPSTASCSCLRGRRWPSPRGCCSPPPARWWPTCCTRADADGIARARALRDLLVEQNAAGGNLPYFDLPLNGVPVVAVGAWLTRFGTETEQEDGIRLLAIGDRWAYNRSLPALAWAPLQALAERARPGRLAALREEYADRPGYDLVPETRVLLAGVTSSG